MSHTLPRFQKVGNGTGDGRLHRPSSLYDNVNREVNPRPLSQILNLSTTVPQNLVRSNFASRHTPTRNSLRHSRMLGMTKGGMLPKKYLPPIIQHYKAGLLLVILQCVIGLILLALATWLILRSPGLNATVIPYWSGGALTLAGLFGSTLLCWCPREFPESRPSIFILKVINVTLSCVAMVSCICATTFAVLHWMQLVSLTCEDDNSSNCSCEVVITYRLLTCWEVENVFSMLLLGSCVLNSVGVVISAALVFILWTSRYSHLYSGLPSFDYSSLVKKRRPLY